MGKGEGNGRIGSQVTEESDLGYLEPYGHQTQQDCSRKREGELISSLEWNDMFQTNTWPRSFVIVGVISEL